MNIFLVNKVIIKLFTVIEIVKNHLVESKLFKMWEICFTSLAIVLTLFLLVITNLMI